MCSNYGLNPNSLVVDQKLINLGGLWKHIRDISHSREDILVVIVGGLRRIVGNSNATLF